MQVAEQVRKQIKVPSLKRAEILTRFIEFRDKLGHLKETEDFIEDDLSRAKEAIDKFKQDLKELDESPSLELYMEQNTPIAWDRLIYVKEIPAAVENKQEQQQATSELIKKFICRDTAHVIFRDTEKNS
ncbi:unnamed protein product [Adineta steineri]|uniref:Uncharacterized protein n=1 Tax=Adineta steineri TaxID=433720 RepID=A0A815ABT6_9BILA|nr:unnamed protein product [Adineta steineri]CAF3533776.1 unnamed protein product [Adineta steineri]